MNSNAFISHLLEHALDTFIISLTAHCSLPTAFQISPKLNFSNLIQTIQRHPNSKANTIIIIDEDGLGLASKVSNALERPGCFHLIHGWNHFYSLYSKYLIPEASSQFVQQCQMHQKVLVQAVWYHVGFDFPCMILPHLYLSGQKGAYENHLNEFEIKHVIRLGLSFPNHSKNVDYYDYQIVDDENQQMDHLFLPLAKLIHECRLKQENVLVHCQAGVSRSSTIILAYLILMMDMSLHDAFLKSFVSRPIVRPNAGFAKQLMELEYEKKGRNSISLYWISVSFKHFLNYLQLLDLLENIK